MWQEWANIFLGSSGKFRFFLFFFFGRPWSSFRNKALLDRVTIWEREENKCGSHYLKKLQIKIFSVFIPRNSGLKGKTNMLAATWWYMYWRSRGKWFWFFFKIEHKNFKFQFLRGFMDYASPCNEVRFFNQG